MGNPAKKQVFYSLIISGEVHNITGRKRTPKGYVSICIKSHPHTDPNGYVFEHRVMMEMYLGRYLTNEEIVHHKNEVKHDNRIENLEVMHRKEHTLHHHIGKSRTKETKEKISIAAKERLSIKHNHPTYKQIDKTKLMELVKLHGPTAAAKKLGVTRRTIYNKLKEYELMEWYKNDE